MKVLITGVAGFIGSHMAEHLLRANYEVVGVDNLSDYYDVEQKRDNLRQLEHPGFDFLHLDLCNSDRLTALDKNFDFIFHFAVQPGLSETSIFQSYLDNNVLATQNLINFAKEQNDLRHFFNISSSSVYGTKANVSEDTSPKPISFYGVTKLAGEQLVMAQCREGFFSASSLRLFSVYGPRERQDKMFSKLIDCAFTGTSFPLFEGSLDHQRSFTYVGDIVQGLCDALKNYRTINGEIINLGHFDKHSTQEAILTVERLLKTHISFNILPSRNGNQTETRAVIQKARNLLNYQPRTSLEKGVIEQINWFKNKYRLKNKV
jgi:nucleoside-diphosphate-sugar epimerase